MKTNIISLIIIGLFCNVFSFGQGKVLLENGSYVNMSSIEINGESVTLTTDNKETQKITKAELLVVLPEGEKPYAFLQKNDKKIKFKKDAISKYYQGVDIARLFAYKYYKGIYDVGELYQKNPGYTFSEEEFKNVFDEEQRSLKKRSNISMGVGIGALVIGSALFISTVSQASDL